MSKLDHINAILNGMNELVASMDCEFNYTYFNDAYKNEFNKIFRGEKEGIKFGDNMLKLLEHIPEEHDKAKTIWQRAINGEEFMIIETFGQ
jgi:hypothetical protein